MPRLTQLLGGSAGFGIQAALTLKPVALMPRCCASLVPDTCSRCPDLMPWQVPPGSWAAPPPSPDLPLPVCPHRTLKVTVVYLLLQLRRHTTGEGQPRPLGTKSSQSRGPAPHWKAEGTSHEPMRVLVQSAMYFYFSQGPLNALIKKKKFSRKCT